MISNSVEPANARDGDHVRFQYNGKERWGKVDFNSPVGHLMTVENDYGFKSFRYENIEDFQIEE